MAVRTSRRLPGFRFEVQPPPLTDVLPRMDVAVFVGFAASGPLHIPVVVEDVAQFTTIFGEDIPLAWDQQRGEIVYAYLASAVRAFFRNGGRRCWVIRVAGNAQYNYFPIPGLVQVDVGEDGSIKETRPAFARARSEGSWSDSLRVAAILLSQSYLVEQFSISTENQQIDLTVVAPEPSNDIVVGDLLRLTFHKQNYMLMFVVQAVQALPGDETSPPSEGGPSAKSRFLKIKGKTSVWCLLSSSPPSVASPTSPPATEVRARLGSDTIECERLNFELWVKQDNSYSTRLSNLGFEADHPYYWDALPTDLQLYQPDEATKPLSTDLYADLWATASNPRFPLAGTHAANSFYIPIAMPVLPDQFSGPESLSATPLDRDGLCKFEANLFLDRDLRESYTPDLLAQADFIRYQSSSPRSLTGIHAALEIEEATLIAVPDAIHRDWKPLHKLDVPDLSPSASPPHPEWWHFLGCDPPPTIPLVHEPQWGNFLNCDIRLIGIPVLSRDGEPDEHGTFKLFWTLPETDSKNTRYVLQEATNPSFVGAVVLDYYTVKESSVVIYGRSPSLYYYRIRAEVKSVPEDWSNSVPGDWSNGVVVPVVAPGQQWQLNTVEEYSDDTLVAVQRSLLRMCAARADIFAVLALPEHYREDAATRHVTTLTSPFGPTKQINKRLIDCPLPPLVNKDTINIGPLNSGEANALSYGALYHPWLSGREENLTTEVRRTPPDGAMCGVMARRAIVRGAWIAPANEALSSVVALTPAISRTNWLRLQEAQINLIRQEPRGFLTLSADTLSGDPDLRPINVRRLLILLRRLALRLGATYVFEPNSDAFRRLVQRNFESMLGQMFARGAFAGSTPQTAFQVVTDTALNTPQSVEAGRFIVELRVAPSLPMTFLTIRLVQTSERSLVTEVS